METNSVQVWLGVGQLVTTVGLALLTGIYVRLTNRIAESAERQSQEQKRSTQAGLLNQIISEYGARAIGDAVRAVREFQRHHGQNFEAVYEQQLQSERRELSEAHQLDTTSRRLLSNYFFRLATMCESGLLDKHLVAAALGLGPIATYLEVIDPLDQALRRAEGRKATRKTRIFFETLRQEHLFEE